MANSSNLVTLMSDLERYESTFSEYCKRAKRSDVMKDWINKFIPEHITNVLDVESTGELKILSVGGGTGRDEAIILKQLLTKFPKIKHTVIEPNDKHIRQYKDVTAELNEEFTGISFVWHHQTLEEFRRNSSKHQLKYHLIMAFHVLYYFDDLEDILKYSMSMLEAGGKFLAIMEGDDSGMTKIVEKFPQLQDPLYKPISTRHIEQTLKTINIPFTSHRINLNLDATGCFDDTSPEGSLLIDFVTHVPYLKKLASPALYDSIIEYLKSDDVSLPDSGDGKHWFRSCFDAILV